MFYSIGARARTTRYANFLATKPLGSRALGLQVLGFYSIGASARTTRYANFLATKALGSRALGLQVLGFQGSRL